MPENSIPIAQLRNLGPKTAAKLSEIGIATRGDLEERGVVLAFLQIEGLYPRWAHIIFLWAMWGALNDCDWREISPETKAQLRAALESPTEL